MRKMLTVDDIHFTFQEGYLPTPRCRKLRYRDARGTTSAQVLLLTEPDIDAPVAFRFADSRLTAAMGYDYYGDEKHRVNKEVRIFDGKLYERDHNGNHYCQGKGWFNGDDFMERLKDFDRRSPNLCYSIGKIPTSLEDFHAAIAAKAESVVLMQRDDGEIGVWIECGEPRYMFLTFGLGHNHGGTGLFIEQHYNDNVSHNNYFDALHREDAIKAAVDVALRRGDDQSMDSIMRCENIEVLIPEAVKVNPAQQHGDGDPFINSLNAITESSDSAMEAGLLAIAFTGMTLKEEKA